MKKVITFNHQEKLGYHSLYSRYTQTCNLRALYEAVLIPDDVHTTINEAKRVVLTGIGTSKAHAHYLHSLLDDQYKLCCFIEPERFQTESGLLKPGDLLIVISQALSDNMSFAIKQAKGAQTPILGITSIDASCSNATKVKRFQCLDHVVQYPPETPDDTLPRIKGPMHGYLAIQKMLGLQLFPDTLPEPTPIPLEFLEALAQSQRVLLVVPGKIEAFAQNLKYKLEEGCRFNTNLATHFGIAHGPNQQLLTQDRSGPKGCIILCQTPETEKTAQGTLQWAQAENTPLWCVTSPSEEDSIFYFEHALNHLMLEVTQHNAIDQKNWPGKQTQGLVYHQGAKQ